MLDFLRQEGIDDHLIARIEQYRNDHPVAESDTIRIPSPKFRYYGSEIWKLAITAIVVPGYEIGDSVHHSGERFIDNRRIEGTLPEMLTDAMTFCRRNMKIT